MSDVLEVGGTGVRGARAGFFTRERTIARPGYNRWFSVPAAVGIHLCIGMAYGASVFWLPMSHLIADAPATCATQGFFAELTTRSCNWSVSSETAVFEIFIFFLGISAAIWGGWLERAGPRKVGCIAALCWGGGLILMALAVQAHLLWLVYLFAVLCGVGGGLGYITPVSTLIKWFPDRRGMATGFAIFGYGGGAMVGAPLADWLMKHFAGNGVPGVVPTLLIMGVVYLIGILVAAIGFRVPPNGWKPAGWTPPATTNAMISQRHVHLRSAWRTPQFWCIWAVLFLNVTAGISMVSVASPMFQDLFGSKLLGLSGTGALTATQKASVATAAAGLVGLISLFNCLGRLFWAWLSDWIGRRNIWFIMLGLGALLYATMPSLGHLGLAALFVLSVCIILSMYGGVFASLPAYLADMFGTQFVGAIHGRLITAWGFASVVGPILITSIRQFQLDHGVAHSHVYDATLYIMACFLVAAFIFNGLVRPVNPVVQMSDEELARERALRHEDRVAANAETAARGRVGAGVVIAWLAVGIPFAWGLCIAVQNAVKLF